MNYSDLKVIILDDNKLTVAIIEKTLLTLGIKPAKCTNEFDALKLLRKDEYHILFLDYNLQNMTGGEFILKLGNGFGRKYLKIFMVSGTDDEEIIEKCLSYGADDYIIKPFDKNVLKLRVNAVLNELNKRTVLSQIHCLAFCNEFSFLEKIDAPHINFHKVSTVFNYQSIKAKFTYNIVIMDQILYLNLKRTSFFDELDEGLKVILLVTESAKEILENDETNRLCDACFISKGTELVNRINYHSTTTKNIIAKHQERKILVVEDTALYMKILKGIFGKLDHSVDFCETGGQAIKYLQESEYDVVLLDLVLPDYNGYDILDMVRKNEKLSETPVVVMSSMKDSEQVKKAIMKGATDYIIKPYNFEIVKNRLDQLFN